MKINDFMNLLGVENFEGKTEGEKLKLIEDCRSKMDKIFDALEEEVFPFQDRAFSMRSRLFEEVYYPKCKELDSNLNNFFCVTLRDFKELNGFSPDIGIKFNDSKEYQLSFALRCGGDNNNGLCTSEDLQEYVGENSLLKNALEEAGFICENNKFVSPLTHYSDYTDVKTHFTAFAENLRNKLEKIG